MPARAKIRLDHKGIGEVLRSAPVAKEVHDRAQAVVTTIQAEGHTVWDAGIKGRAVLVPLPVSLQSYIGDRAGTLVALSHPAGLGMQAKHGVLTRAASATGLDVQKRPAR